MIKSAARSQNGCKQRAWATQTTRTICQQLLNPVSPVELGKRSSSHQRRNN